MLPASNLAIPLDITPAILASSHHRAIASGYHRNGGGIHDVIVTFAGPLSSRARIIARRNIDYVVMCQGAAELIRWANRGPGGLASLLNDGPARPTGSSRLRFRASRACNVWRVRKDMIGSASRLTCRLTSCNPQPLSAWTIDPMPLGARGR